MAELLAGWVVLAVGGVLFAVSAYQRLDTAVDDFGSADRSEWAVIREFARGNGFIAVVLLTAVAVARPPLTWLGLDGAAFSTPAVRTGLAAGVALYAVSELLIAGVTALGLDYVAEGRAATAPDSGAGWAAFLGVALPVVSLGEELLFRGVLVGVAAALLPLGAWPVAALSTLCFAFVHNTGTGGVLVAGALGGCLAATFVLTGSLLSVVLAHTCINALEYGVHEGLGVDPVRLVAGA